MKKRIITASVLIAVLLAFFALRFVSLYFFDIFIGITIVCCAGEVSKVFNRSGRHNNMTLLTIYPVAVLMSLIFSIYFGITFVQILLLQATLLIFFSLVAFVWTVFDKKTAEKERGDITASSYTLKKTLLTAALYLYPNLILSFLFLLNHIGGLGVVTSLTADVGLFVLVMMFITTIMSDTCAYFVGSRLKGPKLCPYISPNKTISGAIGGLIGSTVISLVLFFIFSAIPQHATLFETTGFSALLAVVYGLIASVFSQVGDIFASWLKRRARTKDFSTIFPGHGGFMDRFDGIAFNALLTFIFFALLF